jgi:hypothetical protein
VNPDEEYYDPDPPPDRQQGDILMDVPFIIVPETPNLVVLRSPGNRRPLATIPLQLQTVSELALGDAFEQNQEFIAVKAERVVAAIVTHTCNLEGLDAWLMAPVKPFEGEQAKRVHLWRREYPANFPVRASGATGIPESYIDLADIRAVAKRSLKAGTRLSSMLISTQREFSDHVALFFGRAWGDPAGTPALRDGPYRCFADVLFYDLPIEPTTIIMKAGDPLPDCPNCIKRHKSAQWYPLTKYKKR